MLKLGKKKVAHQLQQMKTNRETDTESPDDEELDLERFSPYQIARLIIQKLKGHGLELLVEAILKVQGYSTFHSSNGADKGVGQMY
jgi:restriction system protein